MAGGVYDRLDANTDLESELLDTDVGPDFDDEQELTNFLLLRIAKAQGALGSAYVGTDLGRDEGRNTSDLEASYNSFEGFTATTDRKEKDLGLVADTLVIRDLTDELDLHLKDPNDESNSLITVESGDSPFVIASVWGIKTKKIWFSRGSNASADHDFNVLAVRTRGRE